MFSLKDIINVLVAHLLVPLIITIMVRLLAPVKFQKIFAVIFPIICGLFVIVPVFYSASWTKHIVLAGKHYYKNLSLSEFVSDNLTAFFFATMVTSATYLYTWFIIQGDIRSKRNHVITDADRDKW